MNLLTLEPQALLIQDIQDFLIELRQILSTFQDQIVAEGLSDQQVVEWIIKQEIEQVYNLMCTKHDTHDWRYVKIYHQLRNLIDLDAKTGRAIQVPQIYGDHCFLDIEIRHGDLFMWYFKHQFPQPNHDYKRRWI